MDFTSLVWKGGFPTNSAYLGNYFSAGQHRVNAKKKYRQYNSYWPGVNLETVAICCLKQYL